MTSLSSSWALFLYNFPTLWNCFVILNEAFESPVQLLTWQEHQHASTLTAHGHLSHAPKRLDFNKGTQTNLS